MGNIGEQYKSYGVTSNGTLQIIKKMCYFNRVKFPASVGVFANGITAFEATASTLLYCQVCLF